MATFNKGSWHYQLVSRYSVYEDWSVTDICSYTRAVILGGLWALFISLVFGCLLGAVSRFFIYLGVITVNGYYPIDDISACGGVLVFFSALAGLLVLRHNYLRDHPKTGPSVFVQAKERVFDGFLASAWEKFHDKTCFEVELDGESPMLDVKEKALWWKFGLTAIVAISALTAFFVWVH